MTDFRHIHLDTVGGIAGDMFVAGMLDAIPELTSRVFADLAAVLPDDCGAPTLTRGTSAGIAVNRFALVSSSLQPAANDSQPADASASPRDGQRAHNHPKGASSPPDCRFPAIVQRISNAPLSAGTAAQAIAILRVLAEAEGKVHGLPIDEVHFHEIADWDSLMDVVAAGSICAALPSIQWSVSDLPRGGGLVRTQHGLLPVPAPATAEILKGFTFRDDGIFGERVTPTGAAILKHLVGRSGGDVPGGRLSAVGTGAGTREMSQMPNILRVMAFESIGLAETVHVLTFDIDDMTGEEVGVAAQRLRDVPGVLDVSIGTRSGKKGRPINDFQLLVRADALERARDQCFLQTTTIGLRRRTEQRTCLVRQHSRSSVDGLDLPVKTVQRPQGQQTKKAESDALAAFESLAERRLKKALAETAEEPT